VERSRDTRSSDAPLLKELLSRSSCTSTYQLTPVLLPKLGWQIFIQGVLPLAFGSKVKQWSIDIYRYLTPLRQHCSDCIADRSVAEIFLRLVLNVRRLL